TRERLERDEAEALERDAREHDEIGRLVEDGQVRIVDAAGEAHAAGHAERRRARLEAWPEPPAATDDQPRVREAGERGQRRPEADAGPQAAHGEEERPPPPPAPPPARPPPP